MTAEYTPGPWALYAWMVYAPGPRGANICAISEPRATNMVEYTKPSFVSRDREEMHANARLIAAAPDLLGSLIEMVDEAELLLALWSEGDPLAIDPGHRERMDRALAAIAKATSEEKPA